MGTLDGSRREPIEVFYAYTHEDERLRQKLEAHLALLQQQGQILNWHDQNISAGTAWKHEINVHLNRAKIILLLISASFLASDYCYSVEMTRALERQQTGEARVIPVLLRDVNWQEAPFSHLQVLPRKGKPVTSRTWHNHDEAFADVAKGIREAVKELQASNGLSRENMPTAECQQSERHRLDILNDTVSPQSSTPPTEQQRDTLDVFHINSLKEAVQHHSLVLFIGSDFTASITGLPSRSDLAQGLAQRYGLDESLPLAEVAQRISQLNNRWVFTAFIRDALDTVGKSPQPFHQHIVKLVQNYQVEMLITTAYDNLLEISFHHMAQGYNRIVSGTEVAFCSADRSTLIKLYGDIQQPDTLVITDRDHFNLLHNREKEAVLDEIRRAFRRNTVLFLGYDMSDPDFRFLFEQIAQGYFSRIAYAIWSGLNKIDVQMWRDRGIIILDVDPLEILKTIGQC